MTAADALVEIPVPVVEAVPVEDAVLAEEAVSADEAAVPVEEAMPVEDAVRADEAAPAQDAVPAGEAAQDAVPADEAAQAHHAVPADQAAHEAVPVELERVEAAEAVIAPVRDAPVGIESVPVESVPVESAPVESAPVESVPVAGPAHELSVEPSATADRAATDAFRELVGGDASAPQGQRVALELRGLRKRYGSVTAVDDVDLVVPAGSFYGVVGPNGAGKTTTLSMITGLLRPDAGTVSIYGHDVWTDPAAAKRALGVLPDRLRLFDRLTGAQLLAYTGSLRGLERGVIERRMRDLATAFGLTASLSRPVSDYSLGMTKKIAIAAALLHAPRILVLDEPFESVDPVSAAAVLAVLRRFTDSGGTVVLSSHSMELIESACDRLAIIADGRILAEGPTADVLRGVALEDRFVELAGGRSAVEGMEWLHSYSDE